MAAVISVLKQSTQASVDSLGQVHRSLDSTHYPDWFALHPKPRMTEGCTPDIRVSSHR